MDRTAEDRITRIPRVAPPTCLALRAEEMRLRAKKRYIRPALQTNAGLLRTEPSDSMIAPMCPFGTAPSAAADPIKLWATGICCAHRRPEQFNAGHGMCQYSRRTAFLMVSRQGPEQTRLRWIWRSPLRPRYPQVLLQGKRYHAAEAERLPHQSPNQPRDIFPSPRPRTYFREAIFIYNDQSDAFL